MKNGNFKITGSHKKSQSQEKLGGTLSLSLKPYWDKSRNNLKIDENERVHSNTL